ncbi:MAG: sporulation protein YunB [Oscillospiraceae bacterium]|jgi:sporulation protein YunB|nr:sporulation protein YunB [Oscillospiraceae bacterium]
MGVKAKRLIVMLRRRSLPAALPLGVAAALACVLLHMVNVRLHPVLTAAASSQAKNLMTQAIDAAVDNCLQQQGLSYADFITIERDGAGKVASMTSNTAANSRFKRQVVEAVARRLSALDSDELGVPLGTLTGQPLLSGAGPSVRVRVDSVGEVTADYENLFTSAGVNQTLHQVNLKILATVYLFLPGEVLPVSVSSTVCVAETVIVGETPDTYLNLEKGNG